MAKYEVKNSIWFAIAEGLRIYFSNIDKFVAYMLFPVFGQLAGIMLALGLSLGFAQKISDKTSNPTHALIFVLLLALPGLLIFVKAFWDYMVAYVALNSMTEGAITSGRVYDFQSHNAVATSRLFKFILMLLVVGILSSLATSIFFVIPGFILWIYFILIFQVFTFESDLSVKDCFKRSFSLIKGNWFRTFILLAILSFFSIYIITQGVSVLFDYLNLTNKICTFFNYYTNTIQLDYINKALAYLKLPIVTPDLISKTIFYSIISAIVMGLTLPVRSVCWTIWYVILKDSKPLTTPRPKRQRKERQENEVD